MAERGHREHSVIKEPNNLTIDERLQSGRRMDTDGEVTSEVGRTVQLRTTKKMQFELIHCSTEVLDAGNIKVEGSTSFPSAPARFYRYAIALKDSKLSIWMEDRKSKKQYKGDLDKKDYVTADNAITGASAEDYLQRELTTGGSGILKLKLLLKLRVLDSAWEAKFEFLLDPVSVERIDIVEAKLRDQEEELMKIDALESKLREQQEKLDILEVAETTSTSLAEFT
ncbi:hypothetical protein JG688_00017451, partial [Phytophthora aleatoria]